MLDEDNPSTTETAGTEGVETPTSAAPAPEAAPETVAASVAAPDAAAAPEDGTEPVPAKKAAKKSPAKKSAKKSAKKAAAADPAPGEEVATDAAADAATDEAPVAPRKRAAKKTAAAKKAAAAPEAEAVGEAPAEAAEEAAAGSGAPMVLFQAPAKTTTRKRATRKAAPAKPAAADEAAADEELLIDGAAAEGDAGTGDATSGEATGEETAARPAKKAARRPAKKAAAAPEGDADESEDEDETAGEETEGAENAENTEGSENENGENGEGGARRRRRRGGRRRRRGAGEDGGDSDDQDDSAPAASGSDEDGEDGEPGSRRRRTRVRQPRNPEDEITSIGGSTRLEAKKQRRREGREAGRRRAPIVSEAEFLARREAVDRVMVIRQREDLTQIAVIEDKVLVEHYVARESQTSLIGNIYLGRVQNVLPSMEAAFIDIGKGRNAVLYAGEVNWSALGHKDGQPRKVESVLKSGQTILVQVTKDPVGHKGARLTGQISLPGRFLVYVPDGNTSGISRKLPDTERNRLKTLLKEIVPDTAGVIVRTAAEGASEEELTQDVARLTARWADIEKKVAAGKSPDLLYGEPDLTLKVVRDLFTEDFAKLVVQGDEAWKLVEGYVQDVAPDLSERLERYESPDGRDIFAAYRIDEQIAKGLDRKVWLPSGGSLVIDRTEAMTVVDVNTGKFTGSGGNLEETVTKNNLEAAEEMVRQLRLRDIGGIIVIDFIDMVLESNRDLVLRRLVECLGRDRTRHQVAEVTSLGLVQMTRKRIGTGLIEAFSEDCDHCKGRGIVVHEQPIEPSHRSVGMGGGMGGGNGGGGNRGGGNQSGDGDEPRGRRSRGGRNRNRSGGEDAAPQVEPAKPSPMALAGTKPHVEESTAPVDGPVEEGVETAVVENAPGTAAVGNPAAETATAETPAAETPAVDAQSDDLAPVSEEAPAVEAPAVLPDAQDDASLPKGAAPDLDAESAPEPVAETEAVVAAPVVVTTTRRRRAGRPAGPAVAAEPTEPAAEPVAEPVDQEQEQVDPGQVDTEDGEAPVFHVPVKKKGSRKR